MPLSISIAAIAPTGWWSVYFLFSLILATLAFLKNLKYLILFFAHIYENHLLIWQFVFT
jgi:hypothetical protein